jgi:hypothetical protein
MAATKSARLSHCRSIFARYYYDDGKDMYMSHMDLSMDPHVVSIKFGSKSNLMAGENEERVNPVMVREMIKHTQKPSNITGPLVLCGTQNVRAKSLEACIRSGAGRGGGFCVLELR